MITLMNDGGIRLVNEESVASVFALTAREMHVMADTELFDVVELVGGPYDGHRYHVEKGQRKWENNPSIIYSFNKAEYQPIGAKGKILRLEYIGFGKKRGSHAGKR